MILTISLHMQVYLDVGECLITVQSAGDGHSRPTITHRRVVVTTDIAAGESARVGDLVAQAIPALNSLCLAQSLRDER